MSYQKSNTFIKFSYTHEGYTDDCFSLPVTKIKHVVDGEVNLKELCIAFENFVLSCGYRLHPGESIGVVQETY